jgi:hypothetical protein
MLYTETIVVPILNMLNRRAYNEMAYTINLPTGTMRTEGCDEAGTK